MKSLVIAEKPSVARDIARVLHCTKKLSGAMEGSGYVVTWALGHLVTLADPEVYDKKYEQWELNTLPMMPKKMQLVVIKQTAKQFKDVKTQLYRKDIGQIIIATDAGREGELVARWILEKADCRKPIKRLWISSVTDKAIREGFLHLKDGREYNNLYAAAAARAEADWLVGINATRALTCKYNAQLSCGRVQTPTLAMLVEREEKIRNFKKEPYYTAHILAGGMDAVTEKMEDKAQAENVAAACGGKPATVVSVTKEKKTVQPPKLYDLTTLQRDANRLFGFTAKQTLEYTQSLYEKKLVTYPRTDSQYLSDDMGDTAKGVIGAVYKAILFEEPSGIEPDARRVMDSKKVTDHHAIIPTMEIAKADLAAVPEGEMKILSLAANRLLCATGEKHEYETVRAELDCGGAVFSVSGKSVIKNGWKDFEAALKRSYKTTEDKEKEDRKLPELSKGMVFEGEQTNVTEHFTQPPKHFTEDSLLSAMERAGAEDMGDDVERKGLGTPATRADVIEKLVKDGFVKREKKQMLPTEDGVKLITVLPDVVKSPKLTADWENALTLVAKGEYSMREFMGGIEDMVKELVQTYHSVSDEQKSMFGGGAQESLGKCPKCGGDVVKGKFGAYCKNKCGMNVSRAMGAALTDSQVKSLLDGKKTLVKDLKGKKGSYDAYLIPEGVEDFSYTKDGKEIKGSQYKVKLEFPKKKK